MATLHVGLGFERTAAYFEAPTSMFHVNVNVVVEVSMASITFRIMRM